jgi:muramoyltetrapeptide carboxypeptidase
MAKAPGKNSKLIPKLEPGDIIDVIAPGFPCLPEIAGKVQNFLEEQGFKARIPQDIIEDHPLFSNSDPKRIRMLVKAVKAPDSKVIWCLRGGYGSNRLLPALRKLPKQKPKLLIGISDVTSLQGFLIQNWGWTGLHAPLLDRLVKGQVPKDIEDELWQVLRGEKSELKYSDLQPLNLAARKNKNIHAQVLGGNLKVVEGHVGTQDRFNFAKKIVFFEEIGERGYRVDRMLFHLSEAGAFKNCAAVVLGTFIGGEEPKTDPDAVSLNKVDWVLKNWAQDQKFPVLRGLPCGHDTIQRTLPLGTSGILTTGTQAQLRVLTGVRL